MSEPPTLLTLPTEIRLKILHYAIYIPSHTHSIPHVISVFWPRAFRDPKKYKPSFYGTTTMSSLFVLSRLLHDELEEILVTRFIFSFPHYTRLRSVQDFTTTISPRARALLREIMVGIHIDLGSDETELFMQRHNWNKLLSAQEALIYLKEELPGLKKVHLNVGFVSGPVSGVLVKTKMIFANMIMRMVTVFAPETEVVIANKDHQQCRKDIMQACQERLGELIANPKAKALEYELGDLTLSEDIEWSALTR